MTRPVLLCKMTELSADEVEIRRPDSGWRRCLGGDSLHTGCALLHRVDPVERQAHQSMTGRQLAGLGTNMGLGNNNGPTDAPFRALALCRAVALAE